MTRNLVYYWLSYAPTPMTLEDIFESDDNVIDSMREHRRLTVTDITAGLWLGEAEGVIERAGLDAKGCMTWKAAPKDKAR